MKYRIENKEGLIGDFLGTVPAILSLAEENELQVCIMQPEAEGMADFFFGSNPNIKLAIGHKTSTCNAEMHCLRAFNHAQRFGMHMTQAFADLLYKDLRLETPAKFKMGAVKAWPTDFIVGKHPPFTGHASYITIAPCSRSLGIHERLPMFEWAKFLHAADRTQKYVVLYHERDEQGIMIIKEQLYILDGFKIRDNVHYVKADGFVHLARLIAGSEYLISVVSGPSHIAFHSGIKNVLLTQQTGWGVNPDATRIVPINGHNISDLKGAELYHNIKHRENQGAI